MRFNGSTLHFHAPDFRLSAFHSSLVASGPLECGSTTKQQVTKCFRSPKPIQTGLFMLMCLNIYLLGLPPDAQIWSDMTPVDTTAQWREDWQSASMVNSIVTDPTLRQPGFNLPHQSWMVSTELFCSSSQMGPCQITDMLLWSAADYEPWCGRMSIHKARWRTATTSQSWRWCSQVAGVYSDYSLRETKYI